MTVQTKNFDTLVSDQAAAVQGSASALVDFSEGSILRSVVEAVAGQGLFLQSLVLQVLAVTRAATSTGADLDSFVGDFGLLRENAVAASGFVTFSRFTDTTAALVPVGERVQTADGTQTFIIVEDSTNSAWSGSQNGYVIAAGMASVTVPATGAAGGTGGNVVPGAISLLLSAISGVDTVTNASAFSGGADAESDPALRIRFQGFINALARATLVAIGYAISTVQSGLTYSIAEGVNPDGSSHPGYLTITFDDGSGNPPTLLLDTVAATVDTYRGAGIAFGVFGPTKTTANVVYVISTAAGYDHPSALTTASAAITAYINGLNLGATLHYTRLIQVIYDSSPGITNVSALTINGGTSDLTAATAQVIRAGTVSGT